MSKHTKNPVLPRQAGKTEATVDTSMNLDFEVTSSKPAWLMVNMPDGSKWRISVATMIDAVRAKVVEGQQSFDLDLRWQAKWERVDD
jgi:hypothetical protein